MPESELAVVELKDGEATVVEWTGETLSEPIGDLEVTYRVDRKIAERFNLWHGEFTVGLSKSPNQPPQTPSSRTPAADAPVAPPSGAAGR